MTVCLLAAMVACPLVGPSGSTFSLSRVFDRSIPYDQNVDAVIFHTTRLPRALFGALVGFGLAIAGAVFQALLRNDLATPYTLGLSGGASLGALLAMHFGHGLFGASLLVPLGAFIGAVGVVLFIGALASRAGRGFSTTTLLLAGVTLNLVFSAFILLLEYISDPYQTFKMIRWMMGGLDVTDVSIPISLAAPVLACGAGIWVLARSLDLLSLGEDAALHLGVHVARARWAALVLSGLMTALLVAYSGPIGFVGLIVPHTVRLLFGPGHRFLLPASGLLGATFLILCDTFARTAVRDVEIPVGIITAFLGGPFFLFILLREANHPGR
jgi:iron complex transport system permease protein